MKSKNIKNKLKNSISGQILLWLTISLLIYTFIIIAIVYVRVEKKLIQDERKIVELENSHHLQKIDETSDNILDILRTTQKTLNNVNLSKEAELEYLATTLGLDENYPDGVYIGESDGNFIDASGWTPDDDYIVTERDWYIDGMKNETAQFGEVYLDELSGGYIVTATVKMA